MCESFTSFSSWIDTHRTFDQERDANCHAEIILKTKKRFFFLALVIYSFSYTLEPSGSLTVIITFRLAFTHA
jgi:hypothetical protein